MRTNILNFIFIACFLGLVISCSGKKFDGAFTGTLTAQTNTAGTTGGEEKNLLVLVKQDGSEAVLNISGSRLLGDCRLRANINKNGTAYIDNPQTCSNALPLVGSISVGGDELVFSLRGYGQSSNEYYLFRGLKK